jgi:hypothetical protein
MDERARSSEYVCTTQAKVFTLSFAVVWAFPQLVGFVQTASHCSGHSGGRTENIAPLYINTYTLALTVTPTSHTGDIPGSALPDADVVAVEIRRPGDVLDTAEFEGWDGLQVEVGRGICKICLCR